MPKTILLKRSSMKGGQGRGGRNTKMVTELQLYFALLPNGEGRIDKKGLL